MRDISMFVDVETRGIDWVYDRRIARIIDWPRKSWRAMSPSICAFGTWLCRSEFDYIRNIKAVVPAIAGKRLSNVGLIVPHGRACS